MTTVSIRARPATMDDLQDGQVLLLPIWNERGPGHRAVTVHEFKSPKGVWFFRFDGVEKMLPDFFPENCFVPCP